MEKITIKSLDDLAKMAEGGKKLSEIKNVLKEAVGVGVSAADIEKLADDLIKKSGGEASFKMVPGYSWATCVNLNSGLVHGIPKPEIVFQKGDVASVDIGLFYQGFHTDTSFTVGVEVAPNIKEFLSTGEEALKKAINEVRIGKRIFDISSAMETMIKTAGYSPIRALVGHGVGRALHEEPQIPCFTQGAYQDSPEIVAGMALAIEVMYAKGDPEVVTEKDGWTISTADGKISALYEETVAIDKHGPFVLTDR